MGFRIPVPPPEPVIDPSKVIHMEPEMRIAGLYPVEPKKLKPPTESEEAISILRSR